MKIKNIILKRVLGGGVYMRLNAYMEDFFLLLVSKVNLLNS